MTPRPSRSVRRPGAVRPLVLLLCAALAAAPLPSAVAQVRLPALGESAAEGFPVSTERRLGEQVMREVVRDPAYLDDPVLQEYLMSLWQPLVKAAQARGDIEPDVWSQFAWEAFLVRDRSVNAFALPGGWIGVHLGLIALTATRDELASVLAHELAHVTQRHIARGVVNSQRNSLLGVAGALLAVLAASRSANADMVQAAVVGGQAAAVQGQLNFSRDMEREADRIGFSVLREAGFAPVGMASMFEKLDGANRLNDTGAFPYLRSHPLTIERMSEARSRQLLMPGAAASAGAIEHTLMQARARVLMDPGVQSLRRLQEPLSGLADDAGKDRLGPLYAGALASSLLRDHALAERAATDLLARMASTAPREPRAERAARLLLIQVRQARGDVAGALQALAPLGESDAGRATLLARAQLALDGHAQQPGTVAEPLRRSTEALQTWLAVHPRDGTAWGLLSRTADAAGLRLRALRAHAEASAADGDLNGAIDRFRAAQTAARGATGAQDFIEASIIDARLRELQAQRRALLQELRGDRPERDTPPPEAPSPSPPTPRDAPESATG